MSRILGRYLKKHKYLCLICMIIILIIWQNIFMKCSFSLMYKSNISFYNSKSDTQSAMTIDVDDHHCSFVKKNLSIIHISIIIGGQSTARQFTVLLKSLLFYRRDHIYLHLVVDKSAKISLEHLIMTWKLPQVSVSFYGVENFQKLISWISNNHYSGIYGLLKLVLPTILPLTIEKVIVLDADLIFAGNIIELWKYFDKFNSKQILGLVENQSDWYLDKLDLSTHPWPALGRGFNTGVMLMRLDRLRQSNWQEKVMSTTKKYLKTKGPVQLADQDSINAEIVDNGETIFSLPCEWNMQLGVNSILNLCASVARGDHRLIKLIHWNSPSKGTMENKDSNKDTPIQNGLRRYFAGLRQTFIEYDGNLLRRDLIGAFTVSDRCKNRDSIKPIFNNSNTKQLASPILDGDIFNSLKSASLDEEDECSEIRVEQQIIRRTHLFFLEFNYTSDGPDDVTLVSQLSLDRLQILEDIARHWPGPISLSVYVSDSEANQLVEFVINSPVLLKRWNIAYHMVYKEGQFYPVNSLRNIALKYSVTDFIFIIDFDFLPSLELYPYARDVIKKHILTQKELNMKIGLIVPAFETFQYRLNFPKSKGDLLTMLNTGEISPFREDVWQAGHGATDYAQWKAATRPYEVHWKADYEPYVIVSRKGGVFFDTRFVGFGWNKVAYIMGLDILAYKFIVLPNAFIIHLPHAPSLDVARFRTTALYRNCLNKFKIEYIKSLAKTYGVRALKYLQFRKDQPT